MRSLQYVDICSLLSVSAFYALIWFQRSRCLLTLELHASQPDVTSKKGRHVGTCIKILDMTGLRLSAFSRLKTSTAIATVDDLNYPEKTDTYYIVNAPYVFSACWKVFTFLALV